MFLLRNGFKGVISLVKNADGTFKLAGMASHLEEGSKEVVLEKVLGKVLRSLTIRSLVIDFPGEILIVKIYRISRILSHCGSTPMCSMNTRMFAD